MERLSQIPAMEPGYTEASFASKLQYAYVLLAVIFLNFVEASGHDQQRLLELVLLCSAGLALAWQPGAVPALGREILYPLGAFFALGLISSAVAFAPRYAFYETSSLLLLLLVALAAGRAMANDRSTITRALQVFGAVATLYALKIVVVYLSVWILHAIPEVGDFTPGFSNIRHFNHTETVGLPLLALLYALAQKGSRLRAVWLVTAAIWCAVLLATGGRGTAVGLLAGAVVTLALRRRAALPFLRPFLLACVAGAVMYLVFFVLLPTMVGRLPFGEAGSLVQRTVADPASGRTLLWKRAVELIVAHPWLGVGPLHFAHDGADLNIGAHPHDWVLQIAVEWGIPALLALCTAIGFAARGLWRAGRLIAPADKADHAMFAAWLFIGTAVVVDGLVSGNLVMPQSQLMIVFFLACAAGWTWTVVPASSAGQSHAAAFATRLLAVAAALTLAWAVGPRFMDKGTEALTGSPDTTQGYVWPRLWREGFF
ncbi:MAG: O-antigen ligase family protein [Telluria sp.]